MKRLLITAFMMPEVAPCSGVLDKINSWDDAFWQLKVTPKNGVDGKENRIFWHNYCCPTISHAAWTEAEEEQLVDLANENQRRNVSASIILQIRKLHLEI